MLPQLGLGTVLQNAKGAHYLCLQASCDSVRLTKPAAFLFVPLHRSDEEPDHVVPVVGKKGAVNFIGLSAPATVYARSRSVTFEPNAKSQTVLAGKLTRRGGLFFTDVDGETYRWVADLKAKRALRTAQRLGQSMGRLGFDEFEPFRRGGD
jgi:hypothetical protein